MFKFFQRFPLVFQFLLIIFFVSIIIAAAFIFDIHLLIMNIDFEFLLMLFLLGFWKPVLWIFGLMLIVALIIILLIAKEFTDPYARQKRLKIRRIRKLAKKK